MQPVPFPRRPGRESAVIYAGRELGDECTPRPGPWRHGREDILKPTPKSIYLRGYGGRRNWSNRSSTVETLHVSASAPDSHLCLQTLLGRLPARLFCMKALVITSLSGPDALSIQEAPDPEVKTGQTLVRVGAGGLNFADFMTSQGGYPGTPPPPLIAGREFSGVEESSGRRVMGYIQWGAFAQKVAAYSNLLWPVPEHWSDEQAAAFPVNYFTAYLAYWQAGMTEMPAAGRILPL